AVELSNYGEAVLNPALPDILALARQRRVRVGLSNGLNLNTASDAVLEALVRERVWSATISIDGASQATYAQYRVRGHFDTVIANVRKINAYKAKHATNLPVLVWQFVVFGHNQHELDAARALARELGMQFRPKPNWDPAFSPLAVAAGGKRGTGGDAVVPAPDCLQLWSNPQVNWDGKVLGCCVNYWGEFGGNAFTDPPDHWLNSERMLHARLMLTGQAP